MAGRVEKIINNKFYFVLDEVGPSDCESELGSEKDVKDPDGRIIRRNVSNTSNQGNKTPLTQEKGSNNTNSQAEDPLHSKVSNESNGPRDGAVVITLDEGPSNSKSNSSNNCTSSPQVITIADSSCEEISAVDMEIESDGECDEQGGDETDAPEPLIRVTFRDQSAERQLKSSLTKFFSQRIEDCTVVTDKENNLVLKVYDREAAELLKTDVVDFDLDTTPSHGKYCDVFFYGKNHDFVLSEKTTESDDPAKLAPKSMCFNCLGNHNLKDCTKSKDFQTINRNRTEFLNKNKTLKISRYHLDEAQKFSGIVPGVLSKKLRNALNLHRDQQPGFIYKMRELGYPPAWLEEAKVSHSGVAMYDYTGVPVLEEDEEEGEILPEGSKDRFDITKIIEFPGFNVPLPNNFKDETKFYGCPEMSDEQSKENMIKLLEPKTVRAYVKKTLTSTKSDDRSQDDSSNLKRPLSPTIEEMEEKKRQLLMELDDVESGSVSVKMNSEDSSSGTLTEPDTPGQSGDSNKELGTVKNSEYGTPILKSFSPFSRLPSREQFSVNVSDVINFENLPNSTGTYETIRHVITKIRVAASKTQSDK